MAKDPVILGSTDGTRVRRQDEIIKDAEKLVDLLFGGRADDQADGRLQSTEPSSKRKHPTNDRSSRLFRENCEVERADGGLRETRAPLAQPESSSVTPASSPSTDEPDRLLPSSSPGPVDCDREPDEVDGFPSSLAFTDKPEEEKEAILTEIAEKLKTIGDRYEQKGCGSASVSTLLSVSLATDVVEQLASNLTYENFKDAISRAMENEPGLQQLVFAYRLASAVASRLGSPESRETASRFYLSYITSNLVGWVVQNGGWGGVLRLLL